MDSPHYFFDEKKFRRWLEEWDYRHPPPRYDHTTQPTISPTVINDEHIFRARLVWIICYVCGFTLCAFVRPYNACSASALLLGWMPNRRKNEFACPTCVAESIASYARAGQEHPLKWDLKQRVLSNY